MKLLNSLENPVGFRQAMINLVAVNNTSLPSSQADESWSFKEDSPQGNG
jgi:hypothetical protein